VATEFGLISSAAAILTILQRLHAQAQNFFFPFSQTPKCRAKSPPFSLITLHNGAALSMNSGDVNEISRKLVWAK
jgi:hypothetical protein